MREEQSWKDFSKTKDTLGHLRKYLSLKAELQVEFSWSIFKCLSWSCFLVQHSFDPVIHIAFLQTAACICFSFFKKKWCYGLSDSCFFFFFSSEGKSEVWAELPCHRLPILRETSWKSDRWDTLWPKRDFNLCGRAVQGKATVFSELACWLTVPFLMSIIGWYFTCGMMSSTSFLGFSRFQKC